MVVLILLCYQWLSRSVICSTEKVSTTAGLSMGLCKELVSTSLLDIRKRFFTVRVVSLWHGFSETLWMPHPWNC